MKRPGIYVPVFLFAGALLYYGIMATNNPGRSDPASRPKSASISMNENCDIQHSSCTLPLAKGSVTLDISPKPVRAMTDLVFRLTLDGPAAQADKEPWIDLDMPDMFMGYNRIYMKRENPGVYSGSGVIVRCPSGNPTWKATVTIPEIGEAVFVFDVVY